MFHSYSLISTILNAIVFVVFILAFATIEQNGFLFFFVGSLNLPSASAKLTTSFHGTIVTVSGTVYANKMLYSNQSNLYELQRDVENLITERFNEASRKFHNECPDSGDTHLDINIDCTLD